MAFPICGGFDDVTHLQTNCRDQSLLIANMIVVGKLESINPLLALFFILLF